MWAWLKAVFGAPEIVTAVANTVRSGVDMVDKAFFTEQEKAENNVKIMDVWLKLQMILANDNSVSALTRRIIAFLIISTFCFLVVFACIIYPLNHEWSGYILKVIVDSQLTYITLGICGFFFFFYNWGKYISKDNVPFSTASIDGEKKKEDK